MCLKNTPVVTFVIIKRDFFTQNVLLFEAVPTRFIHENNSSLIFSRHIAFVFIAVKYS